MTESTGLHSPVNSENVKFRAGDAIHNERWKHYSIALQLKMHVFEAGCLKS